MSFLCSNLTRLSQFKCLSHVPLDDVCDPQFSDQSSAHLNFLQDSCEQYEFTSDKDCVPVKGRLRRALDFLREINAPQFILDVIELGYKLPLLQIPTPFPARNNSSAFEHSAFVGNAISGLIRQGCVVGVFEKLIIINPLSVSIQKSGKERLILDLRHVNQFLFKQTFMCEDLCVAKEVLCTADYMLSFDLKWDYHHVGIFPDHRETFLFRGLFRAVVLGFLNLQCLLLASAQHLIFLRNCSSLWLGNGHQKPRELLFI